MTPPTPDELAAIRARHYPDDRSDPMCAFDEQHWPCDAFRLLAALDAEQQRRERVETLWAEPHHLGFPVSGETGTYDGSIVMVKRDWYDRLRAALVTDASEGEA